MLGDPLDLYYKPQNAGEARSGWLQPGSATPSHRRARGCKDGELQNWTAPIAVPFRGLAATENGTLVTVGSLCDREKTPAAEVWDQPGKDEYPELIGDAPK